MAMQMTDLQLHQLITALTGGGGGGQAAGAVAVVGPMQPCHLGKDKIKRYKRWGDWIQDAENKMKFHKLTTNKQHIGFIRSCTGAKLSDVWTKEARIRLVYIASDVAIPGSLRPKQTTHSRRSRRRAGRHYSSWSAGTRQSLTSCGWSR